VDSENGVTFYRAGEPAAFIHNPRYRGKRDRIGSTRVPVIQREETVVDDGSEILRPGENVGGGRRESPYNTPYA